MDLRFKRTTRPVAYRGFTGHEFLSDFNLYNLNGRLYDPVVGRFLSPDPNIADNRSLKVTTGMLMLGLLIFGVGVDFGFEEPFDY